MVRPNRIKEYIFPDGSLIADANGLFSVFSDYSINGTIQSVYYYSGTYTNTGSLLIFESGIGNSGTGINELILRFRAGSYNVPHYPFVYPDNNQNTTGSPQAYTQRVVQGPLRLVGSGLGNAGSGVGFKIRYI